MLVLEIVLSDYVVFWKTDYEFYSKCKRGSLPPFSCSHCQPISFCRLFRFETCLILRSPG